MSNEKLAAKNKRNKIKEKEKEEENLSKYLLLTDYYEFSMANGYLLEGDLAEKTVVFDYFFRKNPFNGGYAILAGVDRFLDILSNFKFTDEDLEYLKTYPLSDEFIDYLEKMENKITVYGIEEGRVVFANEPILQVHGPLIQCQILETILLNTINFPTLVATKANRMWLESGKQSILEFGARRAQGPNGANTATYASMVGGCSGTSNVMAAKQLGIKALGTQAHSWVMSFPSEYEAFKIYSDIYPDSSILLVDTYDTLNSGVLNAIKVGKELREKGHDLKAIRLDSGDLAELSSKARKMLDEAGFESTKIVISSDVDEYFIHEFKKNGGCADIWGIGTKLVTAAGDSALTGVYKLTEFENEPRIKISSERSKMTIPGKKILVRFYKRKDSNGNNNKGDKNQCFMIQDVIFHQAEINVSYEEAPGFIAQKIFKFLSNTKEHAVNTTNETINLLDIYDPFSEDQDSINETNHDAIEFMLKPLFKDGKRVKKWSSLNERWKKARSRMEKDISMLAPKFTKIHNPSKYPIMISAELNKIRNSLIEKFKNTNDKNITGCDNCGTTLYRF
ncbi:MAG: nicotinate phosphoribosyltransferase [Promethearchaeota archaeon]